ncbi:type III-B CRISPR module RAMP protein Cmr4 [Arachnia propionica]|uniref:type III-B CRISPR module RAMP protein Cmr4 n=1 Tax=Arachnia propionica TaxID=1750 RepID=UPI00163A505F|nr:type III-B CRISPR module RAMP protein Cmr4 [Arachnia propionica]
MTLNLLWQAITPLHVGTGQDGGGLVDLPVAREAATGFPILPASGIKGGFRDGVYDEAANARYGTTEKQGDVTFTDARLFALAVPSFKGTFALVTCPLVLHRLRRDREYLLPGQGTLPQISVNDDGVIAPDALVTGEHVRLRDHRLPRAGSATRLGRYADILLAGLPETDRQTVTERLCVVSDQVFSFLCETSLDISPHVRLNPDSKTVEHGALWWEECIPAESLLTNFVICRRGTDAGVFRSRQLRRVGGKGTVGRGLVLTVAAKEA